MNFDDFYLLGHIAKTYGLTGEIVVHLDVNDPNYYGNLDVMFVREHNQLVPHFIQKIQIFRNQARIALEDLTAREEADRLVGKEVFLPVKYLPKLKKGEYYFHDLIGFDVIKENKVLGIVEKIYDLGTQYLFSTLVNGKEVMIPLNKSILKEVDLENRKIVVELPDGLIDIYTGS